jgi:putative transposase
MKAIATEQQVEILTTLARSTQIPHAEVLRARIVLGVCAGQSNAATAIEVGCHPNIVSKWKMRWIRQQPTLAVMESELTPQAYRVQMRQTLADAERSGRPSHFSAEQLCQIMAVACQIPETFGRPVTHWTPGELAAEVIQQGIVDSISARHIGRFLKRVRAETPSVTVLADQ